MTDVRHTGTNEHFVDFNAGNFRQGFGIVRVVRAAHDWLFDVGQIDFDYVGVFGVFVSTHQTWVGQPCFHCLCATLQSAWVAIAFRDHPAQHHDVGTQVFSYRFFRQVDGTTGGRTLSRGVRQFERLFNRQVFQTFDFQNTAGEFVDLTFLLNGQDALFDTVQRNGVHQIAQGDTRLHLAFEAHQHRFRHIQWHNTGRCGERHQTRTRREGNTHREAGVGVTTGTHRVRQQHAVQPGVDDTVARTQCHTATGLDKVRHGVLHFNVNRLRIRRRVTERLHHQIRLEAQTRQVFQFVTGHRPRSVLRAYSRHLRFAVSARTYALAFFQTTSLTHHFLRQSEAFGACFRVNRQTESVGCAQVQGSTGLSGQTTTDDQRDTSASLNFVQDDIGFEFEFGDNVTGFVQDFAFVWTDIDHVTHVHLVDRRFEYQSTGIFHGVEEDRGHFRTDTHTAAALVRYARNVITEEPQHRVGGRLTRRAGTDNVTHKGNGQAFGFDLFDLLHRAGYAVLFWSQTVAGHLISSAGVQRDIRAGPGIRSRRQVIGIGFAGDFEHGHLDGFSNLVALGEPLSVGPGFHQFFGNGIAGVHFVLYVVEGIKHQQGVLQFFSGQRSQLSVVQQLNQRGDVVATLHHTQQLNRLFFGYQRRSRFIFDDGRQEGGFYVGGFVNTGWDAVFQQINQNGFFASRWVFQQLNQSNSLLSVQWLGRNIQFSTFSDVCAISF